MGTPRDERQKDLFKPALEAIIDLEHPLVWLAARIDWGFLERRFGAVYRPGAGQPPLPTRLMAGLAILKHMHSLSDEALCARWLENPYFQFFCGEHSFWHALPFDRSSMTRWRQRMGEERLVALLQESLSVVHRSGAIENKDLERVAVDTTVQPKAVAHDARLTHRALVQAGGAGEADRRRAAAELFAGGESGRRSWSAATRTRTSSSAPAGSCASCAPARPGATSSARSTATRRALPASGRSCCWRIGC